MGWTGGERPKRELKSSRDEREMRQDLEKQLELVDLLAYMWWRFVFFLIKLEEAKICNAKRKSQSQQENSKCGDKKGGDGNLTEWLKGGQQNKFFFSSVRGFGV